MCVSICFTGQGVQEPRCEFPQAAATGIDPIHWQDWTAAVSSHRDRWNVRWLAVKASGKCCDWYCCGTKPCITGRNYDKLPADVCRTLSINITLWLLWLGVWFCLELQGGCLKVDGVGLFVTRSWCAGEDYCQGNPDRSSTASCFL